jgi:hypothetical protein
MLIKVIKFMNIQSDTIQRLDDSWIPKQTWRLDSVENRNVIRLKKGSLIKY